ncbi:MAG: DUF4349 domain-containing protein [Flavobacteriales bacterium]|nr:DUF4349 domain-containing protein [Flavobacteriales bacterium]
MRNSIKTLSFIIAFGASSCAGADNESYAEDRMEMKYETEEGAAAAPYEEYTENESYAEDDYEYSKKDVVRSEDQQQGITSVAASSINDGNLRFIRKADIIYKTENVRNTTYFLENAVAKLGGIVTYTNLYSDIHNVKKVAVSNDSSLQITSYQVNNDITIRIPKHQLDSLLKVISTTVIFLDQRVITAEEISLKELKNQLEQNRMSNYQVQLKDAIENKDGKINNVVDAYENMLQKQKLEDDALIRNKELDYEVEYSTVQLSIYQDLTLDKKLVENELNIEEYEPSFFSELGENLENGWRAVLSLILILANVWFIILPLAAVGIYFLRKKRMQNKK